MGAAEASIVAALIAAVGMSAAAWIQARRGAANTGPDGHIAVMLEGVLRWQGGHDEHHRTMELEAGPSSHRHRSRSEAAQLSGP